MVRYILGRLVQMVLVLVLVSVPIFMLIHIAPGDPIQAQLGQDALPDELERLRGIYGLDQPLAVQYVRWATRIVVYGDLGRSYRDHEHVTSKIRIALPNTLLLTGVAFAVSFTLAILIGVLSATRRGSGWDMATTVFSFGGLAMPNFWFALMLMLYFSVRLHWFPATGLHTLGKPYTALDTMQHLILPVSVLALEGLAGTSRYVRSSMLEVLGLDYIRTARAKGLPASRVVLRHALRNALTPVITFLGFSLAGLAGGALVIETIFAIPGMGRLITESIFTHDYTTLMGTTLFLTGLTVLGVFLSDLAYAVVDPRVKYH